MEHDARLVPIDSLKLYGRNPRKGDVAAIQGSLRVNGQYRPLVVRRKTSEVLAGNHTLKAAQAEGWSEVWATFVDVDAKQAKRIVLVDNRTNDLAGYDEAALVELIGGLPDLTGSGYDEDAVRELVARAVLADAEPPSDEAPEPPEEPKTKPGDLYMLGEHRLACGDSANPDDLERLTQGRQLDLVFTDPPYGISYLPSGDLASKGHLEGDVVSRLGEWDAFAQLIADWMASMISVLRPGGCYYVCMGWDHLGSVFNALRGLGHLPRVLLTWDGSPRA